jgi:hypothetical protein
MAAAPAQAQNPNYTPGDLVLFFQNPGGTGTNNTVYVNLGNTATLFRQASAGTEGATNLLNIVNISSTMISAFGANWASEITLYSGLAGVWGTSGLSNALQNGDPNRTVYVSQARAGLGILGQPNSAAPSIGSDGGMTTASNGIVDQNNVFETQFLTAQGIASTAISRIDDQNTFIQPGNQGAAFSAFPDGIQQQGAAGSFGTFGPVGDVQFALDLYRILGKTGIAGQVDGTLREGSFEGTVVVDGAGNVSFVAVPEPSTGVLMLAAAGIAGFIRRRRTA